MDFERTYTHLDREQASALLEVGILMTQARKLAPRMTTAALNEWREAITRLIPAATRLLEALPAPSRGIDPMLSAEQRFLLSQLVPCINGRMVFDCLTEAAERTASQLAHAGYGFTCRKGEHPLRFTASDEGERQHALLIGKRLTSAR